MIKPYIALLFFSKLRFEKKLKNRSTVPSSPVASQSSQLVETSEELFFPLVQNSQNLTRRKIQQYQLIIDIVVYYSITNTVIFSNVNSRVIGCLQ